MSRSLMAAYASRTTSMFSLRHRQLPQPRGFQRDVVDVLAPADDLSAAHGVDDRVPKLRFDPARP